jgi:pimeloyl-ACP methyl ester carboxylesterase
MQLFYRELGQGQPLIILHGVFGSSDNWLTPSKMLAQHFHVYLIDQRNHGHSLHSSEFTNKVLADDLGEFIQTHSLARPIIMGHSMGGKVAMEFAARKDSNLAKLIVVDIAPKYYPPHHQKILEGFNAINLSSLKSRQEADEILSLHEPELGVRQFLLKNLYRNDQGEFAWRINLPVLNEKINNIGEPLSETAKINVPTLFVRGEKSRYIKDQDLELIRKIFSDFRLETIAGAGHWVQAEKPKEFLDVVLKFLL